MDMATFHRIAGLAFCGFLGALPHLSAQTNDIVELYGGFNYTKTTPEAVVPKTGMNGFVVGVGAFAYHWFGAAFEVSKQYGTVGSGAGTFANADLHESSYLAGPQFRVLNRKYVSVTAKTLLGGVQGQVFQPGSMESQTRFAVMLGGNVDFAINRILAIRVEPALYRTSFDHQNQNAFRISFGPVLRFGHE
jgi:hypothetical protein